MSIAAALALFAAQGAVADYRARPPQDEVIYFVLPGPVRKWRRG